MKKLIVITLLFLSINLISQDTIPLKKFSLGVGPTWGTLGWGANLNLAYSASKKINIRLRGVLGSGKEYQITNQYDGRISRIFAYDISASVNYYLLGKTSSKYGLYIGVGLGYFDQTDSQADLYDRHYYFGNGAGSNTEKYVAQGLCANISLGANIKAGPGKIYVEGYFTSTIAGNFIDTYTEYQASPAQFNTYVRTDKMSWQNGYQALLCFNMGYAIPF
jgi:hypothetical protein